MSNTNSLFLSLDLNASNPIPKRIQLLPSGEAITGFDGRKWTAKDKIAVVKSSNTYLANHVIDENHATDLAAPNGKTAPAKGWFKNITIEANGEVWADVEWTDEGKQLLSSKSYRYISPVFSSENGEIKTILRASLTNAPNLITLPSLNASHIPDIPEKENYMKTICAALGLPETAAENDVLVKINELKTSLNSQKIDLLAYCPKVDLIAMEARALTAEKKLGELNAATFTASVEVAVSDAIKAGKFPPASKDACLAMCRDESGLEQFKKVAATMTPVLDTNAQAPNGSGSGTKTELNAEDKSFCVAMGLTEEEFKKQRER